MMAIKHQITLRITAVFCCLALLCAPICALAEGDYTPIEYYEEGAFLYTITDEGAVLAKFRSKDAECVIPDTLGGMPVVGIGIDAFGGYPAKTIRRIVMPDTVCFIDDYAFATAVIEEIVLSETLQSIGDSAFRACERLESITLPETLTHIGEAAFMECKLLREITIPEGVTELFDSTFIYCRALETVHLPETFERIYNYVFVGCSNLETINFPDSLCSIGVDAFSFTKLREVTTSRSMVRLDSSFSYCDELTTFVVTEGIRWISECAFMECDSLMSVTIPASVVEMEVLFDRYPGGLYPSSELVVTVERNSYAEKCLKEFGYNFLIIER